MRTHLKWIILAVATVTICLGLAIHALAEKQCPTCGRTYPDSYIRCPIDGAVLIRIKPQPVEPKKPHHHRRASVSVSPSPRKPVARRVIPTARPEPPLPTGIQFSEITDITGRHLLTADLWVDGAFKQPLLGAGFVPLSAGSHKIVVKKSGYVDFTTSIAIASGASITLEPVFLPATGELEVTPTGVLGDRVSVTDDSGAALADGRASGFTLSDLPIGRYTVSVDADGYTTFHQVVEITAGRVSTIQPSLQSKYGSLLVTVPELTVTVNIDGTDSGSSGTPIHLTPGSHDVKLTSDNAHLAISDEQIESGKEATITLGLLDLTGLHYAYDVWFGRDTKTLTDQGKITKIPASPGSWIVRLCRPGFPPFDTSYNVAPDAIVPVNHEPAASTLTVSYQPEDDFNTKDCTWYLDDVQFLADYKGSIEVPVGSHKISFKATGPGYNWKRTNMFGVVLGSQRIGEVVSAEFDVNLTADAPTKIDAQSWTDESGVSGTVFTRPKLGIEVDVNGTEVTTQPW